jgi:serine/threonine-protein kinase
LKVGDKLKASEFSESLFLRDEGLRGRYSGLPADVIAQSARRLRILALLYAFVFFMAGYFPAMLFSGDRARLFSSFVRWGPGAISIAVALLVAALTSNPRVPLRVIMFVGLGFEVASSFGIAAAEFLDPAALDFNAPWVGLSWVAVWTLLFTVVVPSSPRRTVIATLASVSSVPVVIGFVIANNTVRDVTFAKFFFALVFPYLLVVGMAYVGARVIYALGKEVTRARELGGYRLVERLGAGGMGEVWRAKHYLLARPAAIKLVRPESLGASDAGHHRLLQERLGREAQATAMMRSPHTIELYDFGLTNDGTFYYVMELLDGFDMETLVTRFGPIPAERAINLLIQVCHSLGEAHEAGLIHRDIKPANVYLCRYGREVDFVKVLDFGMVKSQRDDENAETKLTNDHAICGTPAFMAPEQALGSALVDGRTDLYGVGCLAYWLITGQLVFKGRTAMEILMQHTQAMPVAPSARTELGVPPALDEIILACLAKNPDDRPASADTLAEALASVVTDSSWTTPRAQKWWDLHHPSRTAMTAISSPKPGSSSAKSPSMTK